MKKIYIPKSLPMILAGLFLIFATTGQESLLIKTGDLELEPGESVQLEAEYTNPAGEVAEVDVVWHVDPGYLGKAGREDMFTAGHPGKVFCTPGTGN